MKMRELLSLYMCQSMHLSFISMVVDLHSIARNYAVILVSGASVFAKLKDT